LDFAKFAKRRCKLARKLRISVLPANRLPNAAANLLRCLAGDWQFYKLPLEISRASAKMPLPICSGVWQVCGK